MAGFIPCTNNDEKRMLKSIGIDSTDKLFSHISKDIQDLAKINIPDGITEFEAVNKLRLLSKKNSNSLDTSHFLGAGVYNHYIPAAVAHLISRPEFFTAYTPYQAEISQGTLMAIFEYQSMICELTGMQASNASLYDGATALAEAMIMAQNISKSKCNRFLVSSAINPLYLEVLKTYANGLDIKLVLIKTNSKGLLDIKSFKNELENDAFGIAIQTPNFYGCVEDIKEIIDELKGTKTISVVSADILSCAILETPGNLGADICVGEAHFLGSSISYGGPLLGYLSTQKKHIRKMPGRIVGQTEDIDGKRGFVLTSQAREQHIKRAKATSNICTNQALCALGASIYLSLYGKYGFVEISKTVLSKTQYALEEFKKVGLSIKYDTKIFREFVIDIEDSKLNKIFKICKTENIIPGIKLSDLNSDYSGILISFTEQNSKEEIDKLVRIFKDNK